MSNSATNATTGEVILKTPPCIKEGNPQARRWCFTLNNWSQADYATMLQCYTHLIVGKETGENGTPHLQGYVEFKTPTRFSTLKKKFPTAHWEKAKGDRQHNITYCSKDGDFYSTFPPTPKERVLKSEYENVIWKEWQQSIINIINNNPDPRKIHWYWEPTGNVGKSYLCKYLALTKPCIIASGKKADIFNQVLTFINANPDENKIIVILDYPRSDMDFINYGAIEQIKNGCLYSGKYEGGICIFEHPHVIIFANEEPDTTRFSKDRWIITRIYN